MRPNFFTFELYQIETMNQTPQTTPSYHQHYIDLVKTDNILQELIEQGEEFVNYLSRFSEQQGNYAYAKGKWTIKEIAGHLADAERVFAYRALRFVRNDKTALPGFEQDDYVAAANFNKRTLADVIEELRLIRASNLALFKTFSDEELERTGTASNNSYTVKALLYVIAGHEKHHFNVLKEKYAQAV